MVLAPSIEEDGCFVCVNITEKRELSDTSCELIQGCHPQLTKPISVVNYGLARDLPVALIERLTSEQRLADFTGTLLNRIQTIAIADGSRLRNKFKRAIEAYLRLAH